MGLGDCRFPLVERAVADVPALADPEFVAGIRRHAESLVRRSRGVSGTFSPPSLSIYFNPKCGTDTLSSSPDAWWCDLLARVAEEDHLRPRANGAPDGQRNGCPHDEGSRDEGMEISDG